MPTTASTKPRSIRSLARALAAHAVQLHDELQVRLLSGDQQLQSARDSLAADLGREVSVDEAANVIAQAATCGGVIVASKPQEWNSATRWFHVQASDWERCALQEIRTEYSVLRTQYSVLDIPASSSAHFYETFLHAYQRCTRKQRGVFFTPAPIADFIVRQVDERLRGEFGLAQGLAAAAGPPYREADASRSPCVLDPACGTGVFLLAVIERLHCQLGDDWNAVVPKILPRLIGIEILPAAAFLAKLNIALKLAATGYSFRQPGSINIRIGDALEPNLQFEICNLKSAIPVVVGNPPFSSLSTNTNPWIARLVRGDDVVCGYVRANGRSLGERKTWLHDDYVKFIRLAQWHVEQAGQGIVGFVTNHGYLDNATFRLMRSELLRAFPHIQIVDLHGSRKKGEQSPDGSRDENVFGLDQGTAISILTRSVSEGVTPTRSVSEGVIPRIEYAELWGSRDEKLAALGTPSLTLRVTIRPAAPDWRFVPTRKTVHPEYDAGWPLTELMPVNTPAPVTARDHFVVAFTADELRQRIEVFRDLSIPADEIRRRYFTRTRSSRYQPGDTRGWQLSEARRIIAADPDWQRHITRCLYRPFDWRHVFWHPAMIDWPRDEMTRHLLHADFKSQPRGGEGERGREGETGSSPPLPRSPSLALIARRQQLPTQPCTFFWIADGLALDGVIRSDNRGSESLFPLYSHDTDDGDQPVSRANFEPRIVTKIAKTVQWSWQPLGSGDLTTNFGPEDLLAYIYALFHSPNYRQRYAEELRSNFPRILPPRSAAQFRTFVNFGRELIDLHLLRTLSPSPSLHLSPSINEFRAGGYLALKKWLQPPHRSPADPQYGQIAAAIARTLEIMDQIDGGMP